MQILITSTAGFIGSYLSRYLSKKGYKIHGIDSIRDCYEKKLKLDKLKRHVSILKKIKTS